MVWLIFHVSHALPGINTTLAVHASLRLTDGDNQYEGRVEVYFDGRWGTVCNDNWDIVDAKYVYTPLVSQILQISLTKLLHSLFYNFLALHVSAPNFNKTSQHNYVYWWYW